MDRRRSGPGPCDRDRTVLHRLPHGRGQRDNRPLIDPTASQNTPGRASSPGPFATSNTPPDSPHQNRPVFRQHFLKPPPRSARAQVIAPELLDELLHEPARRHHAALPALDAGLRRESLATLARHLKAPPRPSRTSCVPSGTSFQVATCPSRHERRPASLAPPSPRHRRRS